MPKTETVYDPNTGVTVEAPKRRDRVVRQLDEQSPTVVPEFERGRYWGIADRSEPTPSQMRRHNVSIFAQALQMRAEKLAGAITGLLPSVDGFDVLRRQGTDTEPVENDHPWRILLRRPNSSWGGYRLWKWMSLVRDLQGHAEAVVQRDAAGMPVALWPVYPEWGTMRKQLDGKGQVSGYIYDWLDGGQRTFDPENVVRIEHPDPVTGGGTASLLERGVYELTSEIESKKYEKGFMEDGRPPNIYIKMDGRGGFQMADSTDREEVSDRMQQGHMGNQANRVPVLQNAEFASVSIDPDQLQMLESREMRKDDIFTITGVPPAMMGKDPTNANVQGATRIFATVTLQPLAIGTASELTQQFERSFQAEEGRLLIQAPNTVPTDEKEKSIINQRRVRNGQATPNEIREEQGMEPRDEEAADRLYLPKSLVPMSMAGMQAAGGAVMPEDPDEERDETAWDLM